MSPAVSIILPTFNRAAFLPDAFASIQGQTCADWELIVVDDGSTDATGAIVDDWARRLPQPLKYIKQENQGAYAARNTGLAHASSPFVAFFDSDDVWLPEYLRLCVDELNGNPDVDWIFAACEIVDPRGQVVSPSTFFVGTVPRPFLSLTAISRGRLHVIADDHALDCHLTDGIYCGLQNSVIRRQVFDADRFWPDYRVVEDAQFLFRALVRGVRVGYLTEVLVTYRLHEGNSSASAVGASRQRLRPISEEKIRGLQRLRETTRLTAAQMRAMNRNLAREYFWHLGYSCLWEAQERAAALSAMRAGLRLNPFDATMWKTYIACLAKSGAHALASR